jgi:hypothetical protein
VTLLTEPNDPDTACSACSWVVTTLVEAMASIRARLRFRLTVTALAGAIVSARARLRARLDATLLAGAMASDSALERPSDADTALTDATAPASACVPWIVAETLLADATASASARLRWSVLLNALTDAIESLIACEAPADASGLDASGENPSIMLLCRRCSRGRHHALRSTPCCARCSRAAMPLAGDTSSN